MAETDREDVIPANLTDLMDVDGNPTDGDSIVRQGDVWVPGHAALPTNGPAFNVWQGLATGSTLNNQAAIIAAWLAMDVAIDPAYETYPGTHPAMGAWDTANTTQLRWLADEPGIYNVYTLAVLQVNGTPDAAAYARFSEPLSVVAGTAWGPDPVATKASVSNVFRASHAMSTLFVSQGMIDGGIGGFVVQAPDYVTGGAERANQLELTVVVERYQPGATFDYSGEL